MVLEGGRESLETVNYSLDGGFRLVLDRWDNWFIILFVTETLSTVEFFIFFIILFIVTKKSLTKFDFVKICTYISVQFPVNFLHLTFLYDISHFTQDNSY